MQLQTLFAILAPVLVTVQAECYKSGDPWGNTAPANDAVQEICDEDGIAGNFRSGELKKDCRNGPSGSGIQYTFEIKYNGPEAAALPDENCRLGLRNEVNACAQGGETTSGDWFYKSDPEAGPCA